MANAGQIIVAGRMPGERIATRIITSNSANINSETEVATLNANVIAGRTYKVTFDTSLFSNQPDSRHQIRIREDNASGAFLMTRTAQRPAGGGSIGNALHVEAEYTADVTETKTFSFTLRVVDAGEARVVAGSGDATYAYVDYIRG